MLRLKLAKNLDFPLRFSHRKIPSFDDRRFCCDTLSFKVWRSSRIMDNMSSPVEKGVGSDFRSQQRTALGKGTRIQRQCNLLITVWEGRDAKSDKCWEGTSSKLLLTAVCGDSFPTDHRWDSTIWQAGLAVLTVLTFLLIEVLNIHHLLLGLLVPQWFMHLYSWNQTVLCPVIGKILKMMWVCVFHQILFSSPRWPRCPLPAPGHLSQSFCSFVVSFCTWHRNSETHRPKTTTKPCEIDIQCHWHSAPRNPQACSSCEAHLSSSIIFSCLCCSWQIWVWKNIHSTPNGKSHFWHCQKLHLPERMKNHPPPPGVSTPPPFPDIFFQVGFFLEKNPGLFETGKTIRFEPDSLGGLGPNPWCWRPGPETWCFFSPPVASSIFFVASTVVLAHKFWKWKYVDQVIIVSLNQATHQYDMEPCGIPFYLYLPTSFNSIITSKLHSFPIVTSSAPLLAEWLVPSPAKKGLLASSSALSLQTPLLNINRPAFLGPSSSPFVATWPLVVLENINTSTTWWHLETLQHLRPFNNPPFPSVDPTCNSILCCSSWRSKKEQSSAATFWRIQIWETTVSISIKL